MDTFRSQVVWKRSGGETVRDFSRDHRVIVAGKLDVHASSAPAYRGNPEYVNPEELFLCSLASCQMLTYLYLAYQNNMRILSYRDDAEAFLGKDSAGHQTIAVVKLTPMVTFEGADSQQTRATAIRLVREAHDQCFVANSVKTDIQIEPRFFFQ
ncbi:MAG: OsmC family protein [Spirochaetia bacterium]|nr:OsmC family protein [Spirochaetia bacterium]